MVLSIDDMLNKLLEEHYTHFLLAHADKLIKFTGEYSSDYYKDIELIKNIYVDACKNYFESEFYQLNKVGIADVVYQDSFIDNVLKEYENKRMM